MTLNVIFDNGTHKIESAGVAYEDNRTEYQSSTPVVTVNGAPAQVSLSGDYTAEIGDAVVITTALVDGSVISYPGAVLKMPIVRHADGLPTDDEIYFSATIIDGLMTASGSLPRSGDWKCLTTRINDALMRVGANWKIKADNVTVLV